MSVMIKRDSFLVQSISLSSWRFFSSHQSFYHHLKKHFLNESEPWHEIIFSSIGYCEKILDYNTGNYSISESNLRYSKQQLLQSKSDRDVRLFLRALQIQWNSKKKSFTSIPADSCPLQCLYDILFFCVTKGINWAINKPFYCFVREKRQDGEFTSHYLVSGEGFLVIVRENCIRTVFFIHESGEVALHKYTRFEFAKNHIKNKISKKYYFSESDGRVERISDPVFIGEKYWEGVENPNPHIPPAISNKRTVELFNKQAYNNIWDKLMYFRKVHNL